MARKITAPSATFFLELVPKTVRCGMLQLRAPRGIRKTQSYDTGDDREQAQ